MSEPLFGCIEAGGTKFVRGVTRVHHHLLRTHRIPTLSPRATIDHPALMVPPGLVEHAGLLGALALAQRAAR